MTDRHIHWQSLLLEAFFVVLGVVLALGANAWFQGRGDQKAAQTARDSIQEELVVNRADVISAAQYHFRLADSLRVLADSVPRVAMFERGFVAPASPLETAWEAAATTGAISDFSYDDALVLGRVYEEQQRYAASTDRVGDMIYNRIFSGGYESVIERAGNLQAVLSTLWYQECGLVERYDEALAYLGAAPGDSPAFCSYLNGR